MLSSVSRRSQLRRVGPGRLPAHVVEHTTVRVFPLGARDRLAVDLGHRGVAAVGERRITLDPEEDERRDDQQQHEAQRKPGVLADEIEHRWA
jgi:hypothetical protein